MNGNIGVVFRRCIAIAAGGGWAGADTKTQNNPLEPVSKSLTCQSTLSYCRTRPPGGEAPPVTLLHSGSPFI